MYKTTIKYLLLSAVFSIQLSLNVFAMEIDKEGENFSTNSNIKKSDDPDQKLQQAVVSVKEAFTVSEIQNLDPDKLLDYLVKKEGMTEIQKKTYNNFSKALEECNEINKKRKNNNEENNSEVKKTKTDTQNKTYFDITPNDIIKRVFSYLDTEALEKIIKINDLYKEEKRKDLDNFIIRKLENEEINFTEEFLKIFDLKYTENAFIKNSYNYNKIINSHCGIISVDIKANNAMLEDILNCIENRKTPVNVLKINNNFIGFSGLNLVYKSISEGNSGKIKKIVFKNEINKKTPLNLDSNKTARESENSNKKKEETTKKIIKQIEEKGTKIDRGRPLDKFFQEK